MQLRDEMKQLEQKMGSRFDSIYGLLDNHVKQRELDEQERAAMGAQLTRHDKWIGQIANKTRTDLPY